MSNSCHHSCDAAAYLADELSASERLGFELHLSACPACRAEVDYSNQLITRLRSVPQVSTSRDLTSSILAKIHEPVQVAPQVSWWSRIGAVAATIALLVGSAVLWNAGAPTVTTAPKIALVDERAASVERALDWFCEHQEADGSWDATKWGGNSRFEIALTALPLIALLDAPELTPERADVVNRAVTFLRNRQNPDGTFGETFRETPYVQSVTTLALLRAYERQPAPDLRRTLDSALKVILSSQTRDGGWAYQYSASPNLPITLWHKEVVELASVLGWKEMNPSVKRVTKWISAQPATDLFAENQAGEEVTDYHHAYFAVASLREKRTAEALERLATIRRNLVAHQANQGDESGTWAPRDQWGRVGGRIYSTALASLALR